MSTHALEIRLFGQPNVLASGIPVKLARRTTTIAMLALLVLRRRQPVTRTFLAFTLFPDYEEEQALTELRRYLYLVGKALPPPPPAEPWLIVDAETVRWNERSGAFVDVVAFEQLASDGAHREAVDLYAGDLLEDVYDDWVVVERERLRSSYLATLSALVEKFRSERDYGQALAYAQRLLAADPLREDVLRQIMAIRYAAGDTPGALASYDRFAKALRDEMGVAPMPETTFVRETIVLGRPLIGSVDRPPAAGKAKAHALPFVGRDDERALLRDRWDRAARGFGTSVFLGGEAGVGKTRLVGELARIVESEGGRVFSGGTTSPESSPYQCVAEALRSALTLLGANSKSALTLSVLAQIFPELEAHARDGAGVAVLPPDREAARLFEAFGAAVTALALARPVLLVLEDVHWASPATIDAIATICRRIDRARVFIVVTYRDEEVPLTHPLRRLRTALGIEQRVTDLYLGRLARSDVERLIISSQSLEAPDPAVVDRLYALSEGNALFLNEAIADARERADTSLPHAEHREIDEIVSSRIGRLSDAAQVVAEIAAVCGAGCSVDVVRDVAGFDMAEAIGGFDELFDRRLIREAGPRDRYDFVFTHHLIGTSIYDRMDPGVRARRHARIAHVVENRDGTVPVDARELARHYAAAGMRERASAWYARAAREAVALFANDDAVTFADRALEHAPDAERTIDMLLVREEANERLGNRAAQLHDLALLQDAVAGDVERRCLVAHRLTRVLRAGDDRAAERRAIEELAGHAKQSGDPRWTAVALVAEAQFALAIGNYAEAKTLALRALAELSRTPAIRERLDAHAILVEAHVALGELGDTERELTAVHDLAVAAHDRSALGDALMRAVSAATVKQEFDRAASAAKEALELFRAIGDRIGQAFALASIATASVRLSRWDEARSSNLAAAAIFEAAGERRGLARAQMNLGMLHARFGDLGPAREFLISARVHHAALGDRRAHTAALLNESFVAYWQRLPSEAKALARDAVDAAKEMGHAAYAATALANLGAAERDLGELDAGIAHMEEGLALQLQLNRMADAVSDLADLALAYEMRGTGARARDLVEQILVIDTTWTNAAVFPPYPLWVVACILHAQGDARADGVRAWAWELASGLAASIADPAFRERFEALPFFTNLQPNADPHAWPTIADVLRKSSPARRETSRVV
jgi:DNA-binding SARP family transcriptional activator/predicted ATPase